MRRWNQVILALAILIATQPLLHRHRSGNPAGDRGPVISASSVAPCAVCATAHAKVLGAAPQLMVTPVVVEQLPPATDLFLSSAPTSSLPSRAPPSA